MVIGLGIATALFYAISEMFQKAAMDRKGNYKEYKLLVWYSIFSLIAGIGAMVIGLNNRSPFDIMVNYPMVFLQVALTYFSLLLSFKSLKYLEVSKEAAISYASSIFVAVGLIFGRHITGLIDNVSEHFTMLSVLTIFFALAGLVLIVALEANQGKDQVKEEYNEYAIKRDGKARVLATLAALMCVLSMVLSGVETVTYTISLEKEIVNPYNYLITYSLLIGVCGFITWLYILLKGKEKYNPFNFKSERVLIFGCIFLFIAGLLFSIAEGQDEQLTNFIKAFAPILVVPLAKLIYNETLPLEEQIGIYLLNMGVIIFWAAEYFNL